MKKKKEFDFLGCEWSLEWQEPTYKVAFDEKAIERFSRLDFISNLLLTISLIINSLVALLSFFYDFNMGLFGSMLFSFVLIMLPQWVVAYLRSRTVRKMFTKIEE